MKKAAIIEAILEFETIIIHRHVRPDPDAYGSQVGLKNLITHSFPNKRVYAVGEENDSLNFLSRMDDIEESTYEKALVIVCDTANTERICDQRYHLGEKIIKIDHHPNNDPYGDIVWVDTTASSTSEMIYELYRQSKESSFQMCAEAARLIYAGIVGDTGRFLFPSTTERTFEIASELVSYPFDRTILYDNLYQINDNIARLRGYILQHFTLSKNGVSTLKLNKETLTSFKVSPEETGSLISVLGDIKGLKVWAFFIEEGPDLIRVRLRSKGPIINGVAEKYNGGGHPLAAGATVSTWAESDQLTDELEQLCQLKE